ncbi:hypothetical protein N7492_008919 [Penicillium capsulatum]|uniref:Uncharacterized protein n=1 Tax=Penicillium capsulatum TaxID=69766 RepID=A0A9W9LGD8_9EURO|nr:hypothetical protein N7492_008919 [Penicillium capsulatum]KAJ6106319.1 hypothetical protein N7512_009836 [Penicillium capsulatum]
MAPIRRYLRISEYSVLECRIYLENPSDSRWLLNPRDPVLPRVFDAIRPLVLPKVREENVRLFSKKKGKPVKDVISEDEFEVGIFLRESRTRHSLLTRHKTFAPKSEEAPEMDKPENGSAESVGAGNAEIIIESDDEADVDLYEIPQALENETGSNQSDRPSKRRKNTRQGQVQDGDIVQDEKKLGFNTHYESFNIWGWVLCLLITRKGDRARPNVAIAEPKQPLMEEWISTQAQTGIDED